MRKEKLIIVSTFLVFLVIGLNSRFNSVPPLARLLSPFTGYLQNSYENIPSGELELSELKQPVKIVFDDRAVPHVFASGEQDLYYAQGYLHAKDRLWQMDFLYRAAAGKLSEVTGALTVGKDRAARRKGLMAAAEKSLELITKKYPATLAHFESYSKGVNAYIRNLKRSDYPVEFKLLDYAPEEWTPLKTICIQKYMADMLSGYDADAERTNSLAFFGKSEYEKLFANPLEQSAPMIDSFITVPVQRSLSSALSMKNKSVIAKGIFHRDMYQPPPGYGSNSWAVSGSRSATHFPILANDPHLALTLPSIWYELQLSCGKTSAYGVSIPGVPYIIIGFNEHIAWGITNGETDVKDWYALKFRNNDSEYYYKGKWLKTDKRIEKIAVYGSKGLSDTVLDTEIGPVVYDHSFAPEPGLANMAMNWTGSIPSNDFNTFYLLNNAADYDDYANAIKSFGCPNLNFTFASKTTVAISHQGMIPQRHGNEGRFVFDGSAAKYSYRPISQDLLPSEKDPEKGFVFSANQQPVGKGYPYTLYGYYGLYRNRTIEKKLSDKRNYNLKDMMALQVDPFDLFAKEALPLMLAGIAKNKLSPEDAIFTDSLKAWDYNSKKESQAALFFQIWWQEFYEETWDEISGLSNPAAMPSPAATLRLLSTDPSSNYFDVQSSPEIETAKDILLSSLKLNVKRFSDYKLRNKNTTVNWGMFKQTTFNHLALISAFSSAPVSCDGSSNSVNASTADWGAGWRMIVQFENGKPKAWGINPGGQSGNPGSAYYGSEIQDWAAGKYYELLYMQTETDNSNLRRLILK